MEPDSRPVKRAYLGHLVKLVKRRQQDIHHQKVIPVNHQPEKIGIHGSFRECCNAVDKPQDKSKQNSVDKNGDEFADEFAQFMSVYNRIYRNLASILEKQTENDTHQRKKEHTHN